MDDNFPKAACAKSLRPVRNRRYSRKSFGVGQRPAKRLFTPEIKRFLKDWLVRRRDNPYPNREEKKVLAIDTGLTYIQICNWFANWRRKLKNAGSERHRKTWGHLIKTYNNQAHGNLEQFSICSDDSIWGEAEPTAASDCAEAAPAGDHCYTTQVANQARTIFQENEKLSPFNFRAPTMTRDTACNAQCYQVSSTTEESKSSLTTSNANKYKSHIMNKYMRGLQSSADPEVDRVIIAKASSVASAPVILSKWMESAAKFQPCQSNYVTWNGNCRNKPEKKQRLQTITVRTDNGITKNLSSDYPLQVDLNPQYRAPAYRGVTKERLVDPGLHGREEVEAAETLTRLANLHKRS